MLAGQDAEALAVSLAHADLLYVGLNCATGPALMADHLRTLSELCRTRVACVPNAGLPDEDGKYREGPEVLPRGLRPLPRRGLAQPRRRLLRHAPARTSPRSPSSSRGRPAAADPAPPARARLRHRGGRADRRQPAAAGRRAHQRARLAAPSRSSIAAGDFEAAAEVGRAQVRGGAQVARRLPAGSRPRRARRRRAPSSTRWSRVVKAPLMIDSTDARVMERALTWCQGKSILNSINLEDGLRPLREGRAARPALRRRARRRPDRREGDGGHRRAQARGRARAATASSPRRWASRRRTSGGTRWSSPAAPATRPTSARRRRRSRACARSRRSSRSRKTILGVSNVSLRPAARGARGPQLGLPLPRDAGRARRRDRQHRAARPLRRDPRRRPAARRGADLPAGSATRRPGEAAVASSPAQFHRVVCVSCCQERLGCAKCC